MLAPLLFPDEALGPVVHEEPKKKPRKRKNVRHNGVQVEVEDLGDSGPNLHLLDVRIYGLQRPMTMCRTDACIINLTDEQAEEWKRKHLPLSCVYTPEDFTPRGQVKILRQRGYSWWEIARDFDGLAKTAALMAIDAGDAIG